MSENVVIGNWKMNGSRDFCRQFVASLLPHVESFGGLRIGLCPPYPYINVLRALLDEAPIALGAQNLNPMPPSAMTGEGCA